MPPVRECKIPTTPKLERKRRNSALGLESHFAIFTVDALFVSSMLPQGRATTASWYCLVILRVSESQSESRPKVAVEIARKDTGVISLCWYTVNVFRVCTFCVLDDVDKMGAQRGRTKQRSLTGYLFVLVCTKCVLCCSIP